MDKEKYDNDLEFDWHSITPIKEVVTEEQDKVKEANKVINKEHNEPPKNISNNKQLVGISKTNLITSGGSSKNLTNVLSKGKI